MSRRVTLVSRGRLSSLADSLDQSLPNPSCDRTATPVTVAHTRADFQRSGILGAAAARGSARAPRREASKTARGRTRRRPIGGQFVEAFGHRLLVADDRGVLGARVALPVQHRAVGRQRCRTSRTARRPALARRVDVVGDATGRPATTRTASSGPTGLGGSLRAGSGRRVRRAWLGPTIHVQVPDVRRPARLQQLRPQRGDVDVGARRAGDHAVRRGS